MMKEELIKFVMEKADREYQDDFPISKIPGWIEEFFSQHQPERLNPETQENECNFCGTPSSKYPKLKCARTAICTNYP